jgi:hypothetical protein
MLSWRASGESRITSNTGSQMHGLGQPGHIVPLPTSSHFTSRCPSLQRSNRSRIRPFATAQPEKQAFGTEQPQLIFRHPNGHDETRRINSVEGELQQTPCRHLSPHQTLLGPPSGHPNLLRRWQGRGQKPRRSNLSMDQKMITHLLTGVRLQKELKRAMIFPSGLRAGPV